MDRVIVYPGALPQDTDELLTNKFGLISEAYQNFSILGTNTVVSGLACTPTAPASLQVNVGVGAIYDIDPTDSTPYGTIGIDNTSVMKQGINQTTQTLTVTPPTTAGFSQIFLVQVILNDVDAGATVLSYYNSANPLQPFSGPNNAGSSNYTQRLCKCIVALKAGVPTTTGSETAPSPDAGYTGLYTITVTNGQTQITSENIAQMPTAPYFPTLPSVPMNVQNNTWLWGTDTGAANAYAVSIPYPIPTAYVAGMGVKFKASNTNLGGVTGATVAFGGTGGTNGAAVVTVVGGTGTAATLNVTISGGAITAVNSVATAGNYSVSPGNPAQVTGAGLSSAELNLSFNAASTINLNGLGNVSIKRATGGDLAPGDINSGQVLSLIYDGVHFQIENYLGTSSTSITSITNNYSTVGIPYVMDTGTQNAIVANFSPAITSQQQVAGLFVAVQLAYAITGACTINVNGLGVKSLTLGDHSNPPYNVFVGGMMLLLAYDGTRYQIVDTSASKTSSNKPTANYYIYVNASTGSDTAYDGTSATVGGGTSGPFKTIGKAMATAFNYVPSQFSIYIEVAAGTYNENVATPAYAGPNVIINGAGSGSTFINGGNGNGVVVNGPNTLTVQNVYVSTAQIYPYVCFAALAGATMWTYNTASGNSGAAVFYTNNGGTLWPGTHTFNGSAYSMFWAIYNGNIDIGANTYTIAAPISTPWGFLRATGNGTITMDNTTGPTFVNPSYVNGPKFDAGGNGVISANGLGINFPPGSSPGTTETGGQALL